MQNYEVFNTTNVNTYTVLGKIDNNLFKGNILLIMEIYHEQFSP